MTEPVVEPEGSGAFVVRVERRHADELATGAVRVEADSPVAAGDAAIVALATARAWAALGRRLLAAGDARAALACADAGLDVLGDAPRDPSVKDDTELKLFAARERVEQGHTADGAEVMLDVLDARCELHRRAQRATFVD